MPRLTVSIINLYILYQWFFKAIHILVITLLLQCTYLYTFTSFRICSKTKITNQTNKQTNKRTNKQTNKQTNKLKTLRFPTVLITHLK